MRCDSHCDTGRAAYGRVRRVSFPAMNGLLARSRGGVGQGMRACFPNFVPGCVGAIRVGWAVPVGQRVLR